jgi:hypothetical protein
VNPFEVLKLDPSATEEEIVRHAERLRQRAADEATQAAIRQAVQALTGKPEDRRLHALLTHPRPAHAAPALDRFVAAFRRPPAVSAPSAVPSLDLAEVEEILRTHMADELEMTPPPFETPIGPDEPDEIRRQEAEALWQSLLFDPRA